MYLYSNNEKKCMLWRRCSRFCFFWDRNWGSSLPDYWGRTSAYLIKYRIWNLYRTWDGRVVSLLWERNKEC